MTTQSTISAISNERLEAIISPWAKSIKNGESGSFWYYNKSDLYWRIANLREQKPLFRKYFGDRLFVVIDAESFRSENESDWNTAFQVSNRSGQQEVIYAITGLDRQLLENDSHAFHIVQKKESLLHPSHFLFFLRFPAIMPRIEINQPSRRKICFIRLSFAPMLFRLSTSSLFSMISIDKEPKRLHDIIIITKRRIMYIESFSDPIIL